MLLRSVDPVVEPPWTRVTGLHNLPQTMTLSFKATGSRFNVDSSAICPAHVSPGVWPRSVAPVCGLSVRPRCVALVCGPGVWRVQMCTD